MTIISLDSSNSNYELPEPDLPPNWQLDESLKALMPAEYDWRLFKRIPECPRFAVRIDGQAPYVWDTVKNRAVALMKQGSKGSAKPSVTHRPKQRPKPQRPRKRVRLYLGRLAGEKPFSLARLIATAVYGPPPHSKSEAHHKEVHADGYDDCWQNLVWRSPRENQGIERIRKGKPPAQRCGARNTNARISYPDLLNLVLDHDMGRATPAALSRKFKLSLSQVRRIIRGTSRGDDVYRIRKTYADLIESQKLRKHH